MDAQTHAECVRVLGCINSNSQVQVDIFSIPVDTNLYPDYKLAVKTPMDLGTIKVRGLLARMPGGALTRCARAAEKPWLEA